MAHGRGTSGKRGLGTGKNSHKTSSSKPAKPAAGIKKTSGSGQGGSAGSAAPAKGRDVKNMGNAGPKRTGPKYGRDKAAKTY